MRQFLYLAAFLAIFGFAQPALAQNPSYQPYGPFGDYSNGRPCPTSGTLTGVYCTGPQTNWVQTGTITCVGCRLKFGGSVTINGAFNGTAGAEDNSGGYYDTGSGDAYDGFGPGKGFAPTFGGGGGGDYSGGGGGHGGAGGVSTDGYGPTAGGIPYSLQIALQGSGGGAGISVSDASSGGPGGAGGAGIYIEAVGNITLTSSAAVNVNGVSGTGGGTTGGGGGSGGGFDARSLGNITVASGATISANGGNGGLSTSGAGGGGVVSLMPGPNGTSTNSGTITVTAGTGGSGAGSGVVVTSAPFTGARAGN